ncbi:PACE efflux transporter [Veillonella agrestimuris]|uniref:PACE efflux transporter n=1 Tax=Veillonella agrestimuris TaxID=2941340 RepID=UPI00203E1498|nr:PACE efflux transporter [Veillonella agrestimuris]
MSFKERLVQSVLFEMGAILIGYLIMLLITHSGESQSHGGSPLLVTILISLTAMVWNFVFNWVFDKFVPGNRLDRGVGIRITHAVLFEGLLLAATIPMIMYFMNMTFVEAFMADISMTLAILGYTYVFNWGYDHLRIRFVNAE